MASLIQIVDENDKPVGVATIKESWEQGLIHQIVRVMLEDADERILLQKRTFGKDLYPGRWDNSAAGHVDGGESYETAAKRELAEEIGLKNIPLQEMGYYKTDGNFEWRKLHRFNKAYRAVIPADTEFKLQKEEVADTQWFTVDEVKRLIKEQPENFTDGTIEVIERFYKTK